MWKSSGAFVLVVEAAKESGTETRGRRNIDIDQSTNQSPSAANLGLYTLAPSPLLTCDCDLGWHLAETVHVNTLFNPLVRLTLAGSPQRVKMFCQQCGRHIFVEAIKPSVIFVQIILRVFTRQFTLKEKRLQDWKQKWIRLKLAFLHFFFSIEKHQRRYREQVKNLTLFPPTAF